MNRDVLYIVESEWDIGEPILYPTKEVALEQIRYIFDSFDMEDEVEMSFDDAISQNLIRVKPIRTFVGG